MNERRSALLHAFAAQENEWRPRAQEGIEANRKSDATVAVCDASGRRVPGAKLRVRQTKHDFRYGANLFMLDELESDWKNNAYKKTFAETFNLATLPFYWKDLEPKPGQLRFDTNSPRIYRRPAPDLCLAYCAAQGLEPKLHCLNYDQCTPLWVPHDVREVKRLLDKRFAEIAARYAGQIPSMEVINETLLRPVYAADRSSTPFFFEPDLVEWSFACAAKHFPQNRLIINEASEPVWRDYHYNRSAYYMLIERALQKGARIDGIGMQYHMFYPRAEEAKRTAPFYDPQRLFDVMDLYAAFGKPLQLTEITIPAYSNTPDDEALQAELLENLYTIWFSHPAMEAIIYWNLVDGYAAFAPQGDMASGENVYHGGLMRFDFTPKPALLALQKLFGETWRTDETLVTNGDGVAHFRGFHGEYALELEGGETRSAHLGKNDANAWTVQV